MEELVHLQLTSNLLTRYHHISCTPDASPLHAVALLLLWVGCLAGLYPVWLAGHAHTWQQNAAKPLPYADL